MGSGQFGIVNKGIIIQSRTAGGDHEVALKTLKAHSSDEEKVKFLQEAAIMAQFKHPNVVTLYGVVSNKEPVSEIYNNVHLCQNFL